MVYAFGDRNPTNPEGVRSATWRSPAEAASTRTFARSQGTATLTIPDLAQPRVGAAIEVAGKDIGAPSWKDMPLAQGNFTVGDGGAGRLPGRQLPRPGSRGGLRRLRHRRLCRGVRREAAVRQDRRETSLNEPVRDREGHSDAKARLATSRLRRRWRCASGTPPSNAPSAASGSTACQCPPGRSSSGRPALPPMVPSCRHSQHCGDRLFDRREPGGGLARAAVDPETGRC